MTKQFITPEMLLQTYIRCRWEGSWRIKHRAKRALAKFSITEFKRKIKEDIPTLMLCEAFPSLWKASTKLTLSEEQLYELVTTGKPVKITT